MTQLYQLHPMTDEPALPDKDWLAKHHDALFFPCKHWKQEIMDPIVLRSPGENVALSFVAGAPGSLIRNDLRDVLGSEFLNAVQLTDVLDSIGVSSPFKAYWSKSHLDFRGNKRSYCYQCDKCGQLLYTTMGENYLLRRDVPDTPLFVTRAGYIIVDEGLYLSLRCSEWRKIDISPVPVLEKPRDGLPADLCNLSEDEERRPPFLKL